MREKIISLAHECLLKPYSNWREMVERQESILNCNDIGDILMTCLMAMLNAQYILGKSPARTATGGALGESATDRNILWLICFISNGFLDST